MLIHKYYRTSSKSTIEPTQHHAYVLGKRTQEGERRQGNCLPKWPSNRPTNMAQHAGISLSDLTRFDPIIAQVKSEIDKVAPLADKTRRAKAKKSNPFCILPFHIRLQIFDLAIEPIHSALFMFNRRTGHVSRFPVPAIARAFDDQVGLESLMVLLEKSTIEIHSGPGQMKLRSFLQNVDFNEATPKDTSYNLGHDCIKAMRFSFFSRFPHKNLPANAFNKDIGLMLSCKNLTIVTTTWVDEDLTYFYSMDGYLPKTIERLREQYRLDGMLGLKKLKHLHLGLEVTDRVYDESGYIGYKQICALKVWLDGEFAKRGRKVMVTTT